MMIPDNRPQSHAQSHNRASMAAANAGGIWMLASTKMGWNGVRGPHWKWLGSACIHLAMEACMWCFHTPMWKCHTLRLLSMQLARTMAGSTMLEWCQRVSLEVAGVGAAPGVSGE